MKNIICKNCGKEISAHNHFCTECGYKIENEVKTIIKDGEVVIPDADGNNETKNKSLEDPKLFLKKVAIIIIIIAIISLLINKVIPSLTK